MSLRDVTGIADESLLSDLARLDIQGEAGRLSALVLTMGGRDHVVVATQTAAGQSLLAVFDAQTFILGNSEHEGHSVHAAMSSPSSLRAVPVLAEAPGTHTG